ncbi:trypsin-like peptidase domain-containing protein [Oceanospirillum beijerinckii]|uniref:trypsin-like peptidase domain-containing protein n=1 Tax=Oceanospirillum beijerinckii TaxID=64976 RepID=UPI00048023E4|nr:trypsin-like peptidase domain-containing protein [Oceanospirillum beijerinckii]
MNELDVLPKTSVQIYLSENYHGSGILVETGGVFYVLSAAHVISQDVSEPLIIDGFYGISEIYGKIEFDAFIGQHEAIRHYDIAVIAVDQKHKFPDFPKISFCEDISFPENSYSFRGTQRSPALKAHTVTPCHLDTPINDERSFCLKVPLEAYTDMKGCVGAEVLGGYSGSGIFIKEADNNYLVGIAQNIDNDDFTGVNCRSIKVIKDSFLPDIDIADFHGGNTQLKLNIAEIKRSITQGMIDERKKANNYGDVENLTKKMDSFIVGWTPEDLDAFINDILVWDDIEHSKIRNHSSYRDLIENAKAIWASGNKKYQVSSIQQGNERFHKILDELTDFLKEELDGTSIKSISPVIAAGEVARLLANCNLDFKK